MTNAGSFSFGGNAEFPYQIFTRSADFDAEYDMALRGGGAQVKGTVEKSKFNVV